MVIVMVDWKQRYNELANMVSEIISNQAIILNHIRESERLSLIERGKKIFYRLKQDVKLNVRFECCDRKEERDFVAGTLIETDHTGTVYLDDDGDGFLDFPPNLLEMVEIDVNDPNIHWEKIVYQG